MIEFIFGIVCFLIFLFFSFRTYKHIRKEQEREENLRELELQSAKIIITIYKELINGDEESYPISLVEYNKFCNDGFIFFKMTDNGQRVYPDLSKPYLSDYKLVIPPYW